MSISKIFLTGCICVLMSSLVFAQTPQTPPGSSSQGTAGGAAMPQTKTYNVDAFVAGIDTDKDGFMTVQEFKAAGLTDRMWTFCDPDGDKKISKKEMGECKLPEAVDMNKDGSLTVDEVVTFEKTSLGKERGPGEAKPE